VIHRLDLHSGNALHLRAAGLDDCRRSSQRLSSCSHFFDDLLNIFLVVLGSLDASGANAKSIK